MWVKRDEASPKLKVGMLVEGQCFGELALMYNSPRAATIQSITECKLWGLSRAHYRDILLYHRTKKFTKTEGFLKAVPLLAPLSPHQIAELAAIMQESSVDANAVIIRQGEKGNLFYILMQGEVQYSKLKEDGTGEEVVGTGKAGEWFGERALIEEDTRAATVTAITQCDMLSVTLEEFQTFIGDLSVLVKQGKAAPVQKNNPVMTHRDDVKFEDLEILNTLGCGAFGRVKLVKKKEAKGAPKGKNSGNCYALKCLIKKHIITNGLEEHVINEKNIMMSLNHPFILKLHNTYKDEKMIYFLIELCQGGEMFAHLRRVDHYSEKDSRFWAASIVLCLGELRAQNIAYRDMKPENIMFDAGGYLKLVDFGLAKVVEDRTWTLCGTPDYLAPEIILSKGHNYAADYWALGVLIYEMMNGYAPFYSSDTMNVYGRIIQNDLHFPFEFSKTAEDLIRKLLKPNQAKRLGVSKGGVENIKKHRWFGGFDWEGLINRKLEAPIKPVVLTDSDVSNFDSYEEDDWKSIPPCSWDPENF